jgi:hypothetical protein
MMDRKEYKLLVEGWRGFLNENSGERPVPSSEEELLSLAMTSQLQNGPMGLHVTFGVAEGGKPFWSNKLTCSELKGGEVSGLKGKLVKSQFGYVGIDLSPDSVKKLKEAYNDHLPEDCKQDVSDTGLKYDLPHHVTFGMGSLSKLSLKDESGKKIKYDLSSFDGKEFTFSAEGFCCEKVEGVNICAVKIKV